MADHPLFFLAPHSEERVALKEAVLGQTVTEQRWAPSLGRSVFHAVVAFLPAVEFHDLETVHDRKG